MALEFTDSCLADAISLFRYYKKLGDGALAQLSDEQVYTTLDPEMNSVAIIIKHLSGNMLSRWTGFPDADGESATAIATLSLCPAGAACRGRPTVGGRMACVFGAWNVDRCGSAAPRDHSRRGSLVMQAIHRQLAHYAYHVGQIVFLAKHLQSENWRSLSIPRNQSAQLIKGRPRRGEPALMRVLIFGATGMVGQGVLRNACWIRDRGGLAVGERHGVQHAKLREIVRPDLFESDIEPELTGFDACFFCLGVSSVGMPEAQYERLTYTLTMAAADTLSRLNPQMTFVYVSGTGTDSTEKGNVALGARQRQDRECDPAIALQSGLYVPAGSHPADARRALQGSRDPGGLRLDETVVSAAAPPVSALYPDHRRHGQGHDQRRQAGRSQANPGELGHPEIVRVYNW